MSPILPYEILSNIVKQSHTFAHSTFLFDIDYTGKQSIKLNTNSKFVNNIKRSMIILADCLYLYQTIDNYMVDTRMGIVGDRSILWSSIYLSGLIGGVDYDLYMTCGDYKRITNIFNKEMRIMSIYLRGISKNKCMMIVEHVLRDMIHYHHRCTGKLVLFYFNDYPNLLTLLDDNDDDYDVSNIRIDDPNSNTIFGIIDFLRKN